MSRLLSLLAFAFLSLNLWSQQLMINEVSQGSGSSEYVEFVVIGNPVCEGDVVPCIDLRKVIIDDNNGFFAPGSGTGVASGALRFADNVFWSCVPQGTYIVVYNEASPNNALPADDLLLNDGNCTLIIPGNSALLESTQNAPNTSDPLYPDDTQWGPSQGWAVVSMNNTNDSFQIPNLGVNGTPLHAVSWGNNTNGAIIFFPGPVGNMVISFENTVNNDFNSQQNWTIEDIATGQTPGAANSPENDLWIGTMNPACRVNPALLFDVTNADCNASNGSIALTISNATDCTILWEGGQTTSTISNLAQGTYTVVVTDTVLGCIYTDSATVGLNNSTLAMNPQVVDETCTNYCNGTVDLQISGGQTPYVETWSQNGSTIPTPTSFCAGTYQVQVTDGNQCQLTQTITVGTGFPFFYSVSNDTIICSGDSIVLKANGGTTYSWIPGNETSSQITVAPMASQNFTVLITQGLCAVSETIVVAVNDCDLAVEFPNIFTPNGDQANENYEPVQLAGIELTSFTIVNRWGEVVYETTSLPIKWDGKIGMKEASAGVYYYLIDCKTITGAELTKHGFLHLVR